MMEKYFKKSLNYWENNKPKYICGIEVTEESWVNIITQITTLNKKVSLAKIETLFKKYEAEEIEKNIASYKLADNIGGIKEHSIFVSYLYDQEKKRQELIDNKAKQIITNVSLLFSAIAFSSAIILSKDNYIASYTEISIIFVIIGFIFGLISLIISVIALDMTKYSRPEEKVVFSSAYRDEESFLKNKIIETFECIQFNTIKNSNKSNRIKLSNWLFIIALFFVALFTGFNIVAINIRNASIKSNENIKPKPTEIKICDTITVKYIKPKK